VHAVGEYLREWCEREGRTPRPHEQMGIAQEQARRALQAPPGHWLVADTTPLMMAIYSDMLFDDKSLYDFALQHQRTTT
jgi:HTH-type transcriptional repressor of NAD biosynthesis genes